MSEPLVRKEAPQSLHSWSLRLLWVTMWALRMLPWGGGDSGAQALPEQEGEVARPHAAPGPTVLKVLWHSTHT